MRTLALLFIFACGNAAPAQSTTAVPEEPTREGHSETPEPRTTETPPHIPEVFSGNTECQSDADCTLALTCCSESVRSGTAAQLLAWNAVCARTSCLVPNSVPDLGEFTPVCVNSACEAQQSAP